MSLLDNASIAANSVQRSGEVSGSTSSTSSSNILSALGAIIGDIGAGIVPEDIYERLLWPQRFYNGFTARHILVLALLMPMGGPLHTAALNVIDRVFQNDLFRGDCVAHMLGTAFFSDSRLEYEVVDTQGVVQKKVRNGLWVSVLAQLPIQKLAAKSQSWEQGASMGKPVR